MARLVPLTDAEGPGFEISGGLFIGRKETCQIRISGPTVSAIQCEVQWNAQHGVFQVIDRSSNGTFVNGRLMEKDQVVQLHDGDVVQLTKRWPHSPALQYRFVAPAGQVRREGTTHTGVSTSCPEETKVLKSVEAHVRDVPGSEVELPDVAKLQCTLKEEEDRAACLTEELERLRGPAVERLEEASYQAQEAEDERHRLERDLKEAKEGVFANLAMVKECEEQGAKLQHLQRNLQSLLSARQSIRQDTSRFRENAEAAWAVQSRLQQLVAEQMASTEKLQLQLSSSVFEIGTHSTDLSSSISEGQERELVACQSGCKHVRHVTKSHEPASAKKRRRKLEAGDIPTMEIL
ncbi:unnamed protein product [Symbiodinium sp. CCMP2592]|nr:unnamed protein product [Symbiodinium sp. CCMP2592]